MTGEGLFGELLAWTGLAGPAAAVSTRDGRVPPGADTVPPGTDSVPAAPKPFVAPPWPFGSTRVPETAPPEPAPAPAPVPFIPTPLPFASTRNTYSPAPSARLPAPLPRPDAALSRAGAPASDNAAPKPFVAPPWPFSSSREPGAAAPAPVPVAGAVPFVPTPLPFPRTPNAHSATLRAPAPQIQAPRAPERAPPPPPRTFGHALARLIGAEPPTPFVAPLLPYDPAPEEPEDSPRVATPPSFVPTPLPFAPTRTTYSAGVEPVFALPKPARRRPRVGQTQAEATARAARFVAAHAAETPRRTAGHQGTRRSADAWGQLSPRGAAVMNAVAAYGGPAPALAAAPGSSPPANARRAQAIERALAKGRAKLAQDRQSVRSPPASVDSSHIGLGLALILILFLEAFGGIVAFALANGYLVLAFGLALDACARTVGTVSAARAGRGFGNGWPWACAMIGSPAVVAFAFYGDGSLVDSDLAPLAGPISALAIICVVIGLAGIPAGL